MWQVVRNDGRVMADYTRLEDARLDAMESNQLSEEFKTPYTYRVIEKKGLIQMDDTGDYYCDGWVVAKQDGTPFKPLTEVPLGNWSGEMAYRYNKKAGLYDNG